MTLRDAVRALLAHLATTAPGRSVEVRVPPYGAIQCVEGPRHTRGTPPNTVETDPVTFLQLAAGRVDWAAAVSDGRIRASGIRSDISALFPIV
jgi:Bacterial SCP ortholog